MTKDELIKFLNSRLGVSALDQALVEIDGIINHCLKLYSQYNKVSATDGTGTLEIENKTTDTHVFDAVDAPDAVEWVFDKDNRIYVDDFCYDNPILSQIYPGTFILRTGNTTIKLSTYADETKMPVDLQDYIFGEYCKAIHHVLNLGKLDIELGIDTQAILDTASEKGLRAYDRIVLHTDLA